MILKRYAIDIGGSILGYKSGKPITFLSANKAERLAKYLSLYADEIGLKGYDNIKVIEICPFKYHKFKITGIIEKLQL